MPTKTVQSESRGYYIKQRPWTPTERRGYIDAEFRTPSPSSFSLPSSIGRAPSHTFGSKLKAKRPDVTPSPSEYTVDHVTRHGKDTPAAAYMSPKIKEPQPYVNPAPGKYHSEYGFISRSDSPQYSFGSKLPGPKPDDLPAPGQYTAPERAIDSISTHRRSPAFSMAEKIGDPKIDPTPAANAYERVVEAQKATKPQLPSYSLGQKITEPPRCKTPAPGDYVPEKVWINKTSLPRFSFGVKHSPHAHSW